MKSDKLCSKIAIMGRQGNLSFLLKHLDNPETSVRLAIASSLSNIETYESEMALIPLLRDLSPKVRAAAAASAATINAKNCEEYVKRLSLNDTDPYVREVAKKSFMILKTSVFEA